MLCRPFGDLSRVWLCYVGPLVILAMFGQCNVGPLADLSRVWLCYVGPLVTLACLFDLCLAMSCRPFGGLSCLASYVGPLVTLACLCYVGPLVTLAVVGYVM